MHSRYLKKKQQKTMKITGLCRVSFACFNYMYFCLPHWQNCYCCFCVDSL